MLANFALVGNENIATIKGTFGGGSLMSSADPELMSHTPRARKSFIGSLFNLITQGLIYSSPATTEVPAKTIDKLLEENQIKGIDIFILDVEGF